MSLLSSLRGGYRDCCASADLAESARVVYERGEIQCTLTRVDGG